MGGDVITPSHPPTYSFLSPANYKNTRIPSPLLFPSSSSSSSPVFRLHEPRFVDHRSVSWIGFDVNRALKYHSQRRQREALIYLVHTWI